MSTESVMLTIHLILCHPLLLLPSIFLFPMNQLFASGGQRIGASASTSVLPMNIQSWFPLGTTGLISLQSKGFKNLHQHHISKESILSCSAFFMVQLSQDYWKNHSSDYKNLCGKVTSLLFKLSRFVTTFFPRSKCFNFMAAIIICSDFGALENKICHRFHLFATKWWRPWS